MSIQAQIINLLIDLKERLNLAMLFISHDLRVVRYISDRVAVMYLGTIVETAPTDELYDNPRHPYTQVLLDAAPSMEEGRVKETKSFAKGELPSPINMPSGCRFHPRCPFADERCKAGVPRAARDSPRAPGRLPPPARRVRRTAAPELRGAAGRRIGNRKRPARRAMSCGALCACGANGTRGGCGMGHGRAWGVQTASRGSRGGPSPDDRSAVEVRDEGALAGAGVLSPDGNLLAGVEPHGRAPTSATCSRFTR